MLKTLGAHIKEFKRDSILTPLFMISEGCRGLKAARHALQCLHEGIAAVRE